MKYYCTLTILVVTLFFLTVQASAQEFLNNLTFSAGYSIPVGKFANPKPNDPLAGLAGSGFYDQINYARPIRKGLGVRFSGRINSNSTNLGPMIAKANSYAIVTGNKYGWQSDVSKWNFWSGFNRPDFISQNKKVRD